MPLIQSFGAHIPALDPNAIILPTSTLIGRVTVAARASVWWGAVLRADVEAISIGERSNVQDRVVIHVTTDRHATRVGEDVTIGHAAVLHGCVIGNRTLIGIGAIVLDGAVVEDDCMIGAGTLVTPGTRIPAGHLALGSPARVLRELRRDERAELRASAERYCRLAQRYCDLGISARL